MATTEDLARLSGGVYTAYWSDEGLGLFYINMWTFAHEPGLTDELLKRRHYVSLNKI